MVGPPFLQAIASCCRMSLLFRLADVDSLPSPRLAVTHPEARPWVSVVIPVYNSEATLARLCEQLIAELAPAWRLQIVLVDDGSTDRSAAECRRLHERHPGMITGVFLSRNFGEHNAVMAGLQAAEGEYCVIMDDDFQNPVAEVERMFLELAKGYDVVYARYEQKQHSWWRNLGSRLHNLMATHALGKPRDLYLSSFKAMSRFVVREILKYEGPDPYLDAIILRVTRHIGVLPVSHHARGQGVSGYTFRKLLSLWGNMIVAFSIWPLRLIGLYGLLIAVMGACYGAFTLVEWWVPGLDEPELTEKLHAFGWFYRGSILVTLSLIGEYVGRISTNLSRAPQYVVRSCLPCRGASRATGPGDGAGDAPGGSD